MKIKKYSRVMRNAFQNHIEYRFNNILWLAYSFIPFFSGLYFWFAAYNGVGFSNSEYSINEIATYYFISLIVSNILNVDMREGEMSSDIRSGEINKYLIKPINYLFFNFFKSLPQVINFIIIGFIPIIFIGIVLRKYIQLSDNFTYYILLIFALIIGYIIHFLIKFLLGSITFFMSNVHGLFLTLDLLKGLVSGLIFPLSILPTPIYNLLKFLPFQYLSFFPVTVLQGKYTYLEIFQLFITGITWVVILYLMCNLLWKRGLLKYSSFGG